MRTKKEFQLLILVPVSEANLRRLQRLAVALWADLTEEERMRVIMGTTPIATVRQFPHAKSFQAIWSRNGTTQDYYVGRISLTREEWLFAQERQAQLPPGIQHVRAYLDPGRDEFVIISTNVPELEKMIGQDFDLPANCLRELGLVPYIPPK